MSKTEITQSVDCGRVEQTPANRPARSVPARDESRKPGKAIRILKWLGILLVAFGLLSTACYVFRAPLLTAIGEVWVVNDQLTKADAIVVLGGGPENRPFAAANLYHDGMAPKIVYMNVMLSPSQTLGITSPEAELTHRLLLSRNVPDNAMEAIGNGVASTHDESLAFKEWLHKTGAKSIIITTDIFHTRRARWVFRKELKGENVKIQLAGANPVNYSAKDWWRKEQGVIGFESEVIKMAYYWVKY